MAERKQPSQQRRPTSRTWMWWVLALLVIGGAGYWAWPRYLRPYASRVRSDVKPGSLSAICAGNVSFQYGHPKQGYARTLAELGPKGGSYIDAMLASGEKSG